MEMMKMTFYILSILWGIVAIVQFVAGDAHDAKLVMIISLLFGIVAELQDRGKS